MAWEHPGFITTSPPKLILEQDGSDCGGDFRLLYGYIKKG